MPVVSISRVRVRSWMYVPAFFIQSLRIGRQAAHSEGSLAVRLLKDRRNTFWTATSWLSDDSMKAFMRAKPHGPTMRKLMNWCDEASFVHWTQPGAELPLWEEAHRRIQQEGRLSKVRHPSAAHTAHAYPTPVVSRTGELRFK